MSVIPFGSRKEDTVRLHATLLQARLGLEGIFGREAIAPFFTEYDELGVGPQRLDHCKGVHARCVILLGEGIARLNEAGLRPTMPLHITSKREAARL
jgi:hypothetical protein